MWRRATLLRPSVKPPAFTRRPLFHLAYKGFKTFCIFNWYVLLLLVAVYISYFPILPSLPPSYPILLNLPSRHFFSSHRITSPHPAFHSHLSSFSFDSPFFIPTCHMLTPPSTLRLPWSRKVASRAFISTRHHSVQLRLISSHLQNNCTRLNFSFPHHQSPIFACRAISSSKTTDRLSNQLHALRPRQRWHRPFCSSSLAPRYVTLIPDPRIFTHSQ